MLSRSGEFSFGVTAAFAVNFIMGSGFLAVPKAFYDAGLLLGPVLMFVCTLVCDMTKNMVLEAMARAEAVTEVRVLAACHASLPRVAVPHLTPRHARLVSVSSDRCRRLGA